MSDKPTTDTSEANKALASAAQPCPDCGRVHDQGPELTDADIPESFNISGDLDPNDEARMRMAEAKRMAEAAGVPKALLLIGAAMIAAMQDTIQEKKSVSATLLFAVMGSSTGVPLHIYQKMLQELVKTGRIAIKSDNLTWIGDKQRGN